MPTNNNNDFDYTRLRQPRRFLGLTIDFVAIKVKMSISYLCRLELGYIKYVKNPNKAKRLQEYIKNIEIVADAKHRASKIPA